MDSTRYGSTVTLMQDIIEDIYEKDSAVVCAVKEWLESLFKDSEKLEED